MIDRESLGVQHQSRSVDRTGAVTSVADDGRTGRREVNPDLVFPAAHRPRLYQTPVAACRQNAHLGQGRESPGLDPSGSILENRDWTVDGHRLRPLDRRTLNEGNVRLVDFPFRKTLRHRGIRFRRLREQHDPGRPGIQPVMDEHATADVPLDESGEAGPCRIRRLVSRQTRWFIGGDQPVVFEQDGQRGRGIRGGNPIEVPHEHRSSTTKDEAGVSNDPPADRDQALEDGLPREPPRYRAPNCLGQFGGEPAVEGNHRVLADHDGNGPH
jgi:hypothetical protein